MTAPGSAPGAVREIDTGEVRDRYARGWHCIGTVKEFSDGAPHSIQAFGTKLVVFVQNVNGTGEDPASFQLISKEGITGYARPPIQF